MVDSTNRSSSPKPDVTSSRSAMLEKFNALKKKREEVTKKSMEERIKEIQQTAVQNVTDALETEMDLLQASTLPLMAKDRKRRHGEESGLNKTTGDDEKSVPGGSGVDGWGSIKPFLNVNAHLKGIDRGRHAPKTQLEMDIDKAIELGDLDRAESLSEQLSNRDFGKKIADAIDAKKYTEQKTKEDELQKAKRKKRLHWGFDHKERWEMKGNM